MDDEAFDMSSTFKGKNLLSEERTLSFELTLTEKGDKNCRVASLVLNTVFMVLSSG